jgi:signal transduction histidine kinase
MGFTRRLIWPAAAMAGVAAILGVLAVLQYRWTTQISDNEHERMRTQLRTAMGQFRQDFYREMVTASAVFQIDGALLSERDWSRFDARYAEWSHNPGNGELVANVYMWDIHAPAARQELQLNRQTGAFVNAVFPEEVRKILKTSPWRAPGGTLRRVAWTFDPSLPGMVRPVYRFRTNRNSRGEESDDRRSWREEAPPPNAELIGATVIELNSQFLLHQLFPALVQKHLNLSGINYHVSIFSTADPAHPIFESGPTPAHGVDKADAELSLVESPFAPTRITGPAARRPEDPSPPELLRQPTVLRRYATAFPAALIPGHVNWRLATQHPAGSLQAAVDITRHANLMMSFGALVILFGSTSLLFAAIHRTRALAKMQMEFVAGVSHELRTPVSVICSAADNLAEGVVEGKVQTQNYGQLIRGEARRLASMIEQILLFSAGKQNTARYNLQPLDIISVVDGVLRDNAAGIASAGMTLERATDPELPHVMGDGGAVARCLENLVSNAIKYGATGGWLRVTASLTSSRGKPEVAITVEDHGMGIASSDLRRVFEPFYRGKSAQDSQIHGTGLGLSLARRLARAMRGDILAESELGRGSRFTLTLPAAEMPLITENESINEPVHTAD